MPRSQLLESLLTGKAAKNIRALAARAALPFPRQQIIEILVALTKDEDPAIAFTAAQTIRYWDKDEIIQLLKSPQCPTAVFEYFTAAHTSPEFLQAVVENHAAPGKLIEFLAARAPAQLLQKILDNRVLIAHNPAILEKIGQNPAVTSEMLDLIERIKTDTTEDCKQETAPASAAVIHSSPLETCNSKSSRLSENLIKEESAPASEADQQTATKQISTLPYKEKLRLALFGTREVRMLLVRDTNHEIAQAVLRSPKLTENEVEAIAAMRGVSEEILKQIGKNKEWIQKYNIVRNLVKNPRTPADIAQRLIFRLNAQDLNLISRDRSIPDIVRYHASRALIQRNTEKSSK